MYESVLMYEPVLCSRLSCNGEQKKSVEFRDMNFIESTVEYMKMRITSICLFNDIDKNESTSELRSTFHVVGLTVLTSAFSDQAKGTASNEDGSTLFHERPTLKNRACSTEQTARRKNRFQILKKKRQRRNALEKC